MSKTEVYFNIHYSTFDIKFLILTVLQPSPVRHDVYSKEHLGQTNAS